MTVLPTPPAHGAKPRVFLFNLCGVVLEACQGSFRSVIDWFHSAPEQFTRIAASPKGVLHNYGTSRFDYDGCYLCLCPPPKGA